MITAYIQSVCTGRFHGHVVMQWYLFSKLFLTQFVQSKELEGQNQILNKTTRCEFDTHNNLSIRDHHSNCSEHNLEVLGQLLPTGVTGVLRKEERVLESYWI